MHNAGHSHLPPPTLFWVWLLDPSNPLLSALTDHTTPESQPPVIPSPAFRNCSNLGMPGIEPGIFYYWVSLLSTRLAMSSSVWIIPQLFTYISVKCWKITHVWVVLITVHHIGQAMFSVLLRVMCFRLYTESCINCEGGPQYIVKRSQQLMN